MLGWSRSMRLLPQGKREWALSQTSWVSLILKTDFPKRLSESYICEVTAGVSNFKVPLLSCQEFGLIRSTQRHTVIKMAKSSIKRVLKATREKTHTKETPQGYQWILQQKVCRPEGSGLMC